ncbi:MAG: hypothetical protein JWN23_2712 [Rhodocyclales bacterium]|nr:hypothetical protein [Rhodocyclales bacterium]
MQAKPFFRVAVLLPLLILLTIRVWQLHIWQHDYGTAQQSFGIQGMSFLKSYFCLGGGQYLIAAAVVLCAMERLRNRGQMQLLFALCPAIFFVICSVVSLLEIYLLPLLGVNIENFTGSLEFAGVLLSVATLLLGGLYAFVISTLFIVMCWFEFIREPSVALFCE